jgi:hypothetical protein
MRVSYMSKVIPLILLFSLLARAENVSVHMMKHQEPPKAMDGYEYIPANASAINAEYRDKFYGYIGLLPYLGKNDEVEKNVLYMRLKKIPLSRITKLYPDLPSEFLRHGAELLKEKR